MANLLIVDDDPAFVDAAREALERVGLTVEGVGTAAQALERLRVSPPLALIVDSQLPDKPGEALVAELRAVDGLATLPVIFVSAYTADAALLHRLKHTLYVHEVLSKPLPPSQLRHVLAAVPALAEASRNSPPDRAELDLVTTVQLLDDFLAIARERLELMRHALAALDGAGGAEALETLCKEGHKLKGSGAAYGLPELTRLGAELEKQAMAAPTPSSLLHARLAGLVEAIASRLARAGAETLAPPVARPLRLLVVDGPTPLAASCAAAASTGMPVRLVADVGRARTAFEAQPADVVVVACDRPDLDGLEACRVLRDANIGPRLLLLGAGSAAARLDALEAGADAFSHRPADIASLLAVAAMVADLSPGLEVLVATAHARVSADVASALSPMSPLVLTCSRATELAATLDAEAPGLVVVGPAAAELDPPTLIRLVRADVRHQAVPLLALGPREAHGALLAAGADDVLSLPLHPEELQSRVRTLLRRLRRTPIVPVPGFPGPEGFRLALGEALALAPRGRAVAVLVFAVAPGTLPLDRLARAAVLDGLGARLRALFRSTDRVAVLDERRCAVLVHDTTRSAAWQLVERHARVLSESLALKLSGSAAAFPEDGADAHVLLRVALRGGEAPGDETQA